MSKARAIGVIAAVIAMAGSIGVVASQDDSSSGPAGDRAKEVSPASEAERIESAFVDGVRGVPDATSFTDDDLIVAGQVGCATLDQFAGVGVEELRLALIELQVSLEDSLGDLIPTLFATRVLYQSIENLCPGWRRARDAALPELLSE